MTISILTNETILQSRRAVGKNFEKATQAMNQVSSGSRLANSQDDPAAKVICAKISSIVNGLEKSSIKAVQDKEMLSVTTGNFDNLLNVLNKGKTLAEQVKSQSLNPQSAAIVKEEFDLLFAERKENKSALDLILDQARFDQNNNMDMNIVKQKNARESKLYNARAPQEGTFDIEETTFSIEGKIDDVTVIENPNLENNFVVRIFLQGDKALEGNVFVAENGELNLKMKGEEGAINDNLFFNLKFADDISGLVENGEVSASKLEQNLKYIFRCDSGETGAYFENQQNYLEGMSVVSHAALPGDVKITYVPSEQSFLVSKEGHTFKTGQLTEGNDFAERIDTLKIEVSLTKGAVEELMSMNEEEINFGFEIAPQSSSIQAGTGKISLDFINFSRAKLGLNDLDLTDAKSIEKTIAKIENAIDKVCSDKSKISCAGGYLETYVDTVTNKIDNFKLFSGAVNDADIAEGITEAVKYQVLAQAAMAMLAQANEQTQMFLKMLS